MTDIIDSLSNRIMSYKEVDSIFINSGYNEKDFCNFVSKICLLYMLEDKSYYNICDVVMNNIYVFMLNNDEIQNSGFPESALSIYYAFDEGEYKHKKEDLHLENPEIMYTIPLLKEIQKKYIL